MDTGFAISHSLQAICLPVLESWYPLSFSQNPGHDPGHLQKNNTFW